MPQYLQVKDYTKHQHYKDRSPPWIKLHYSALSNYEITSLSDAAQGQLWKFWLLASRHDNRIPYDVRYLKREIKPSGPLKLTELIASGLLAVREHDASEMLALARGDARSREVEVEGEVEGETESATANASVAPGRQMLLAALPEPSRRHAMTAAIAHMAQGLDLPPGMGVPTAAQLDGAALDVMATIVPAAVSPKVFRKFLIRTMRGEQDRPSRSGPVSLTDALLAGQGEPL